MKHIVAILMLMSCTLAEAVQPSTGGELRAASDIDSAERFPLKHTEVQAEITGNIASVAVTQTFANPYEEKIEAVYVFPLPNRAAVNDMEIRVGERVIRGVIQKRDEARRLYDAARRDGHVAALLDQERPNIFTQSVTNTLPGNEVVVTIRYFEALPYDSGGYEFSFPMVVGPRSIPGNPTASGRRGWSPNTDEVVDGSRITPPVLPPGRRSAHDISLKVTLDGEKVGGSHGFPMGSQKGAPRRPLTSLRRGLDAVFSPIVCDCAPGNGMAEIRESASNSRVPPRRIFFS